MIQKKGHLHKMCALVPATVKMKARLLDSTNFKIKVYFIKHRTLLLGFKILIKTELGF